MMHTSNHGRSAMLLVTLNIAVGISNNGPSYYLPPECGQLPLKRYAIQAFLPQSSMREGWGGFLCPKGRFVLL